jgi:hypothetical protein
VVHHPALRVAAAHPRAGVHAVLALACFVARAVRVNGALGPAGHIRIAEILRDALACGGTLSSRANGVLAARTGGARVYDFRGCKG